MALDLSVSNDRKVSATLTASKGPIPLDFPVFDEDGDDLAVTVDGVAKVKGTDWVFTGTADDGFYGTPQAWVNGSLLFTHVQTGAVVVSGRRAPRREANYTEGVGIPARDLNHELAKVIAVLQELRRDVDGAALDADLLASISANALIAQNAALAAAAYANSNVPSFASKASAIAATTLDTATEIYVSGFRFAYSASAVLHSGGFQNTASSRWFQYAEPVVWQTFTDHVDFCNGDHALAATASKELGIPLQISSGQVATLTIDPVAEDVTNTNAGRWAVINDAIEWARRCIVSNESMPEVLISGPTGSIGVEGFVHIGNYGTSLSSTTHSILFTMGVPVSNTVTAIQFETVVSGASVVASPKYGGITHIDLSVNSLGDALGTGYANSFAVGISGGSGAGAAATCYAVGGVPQGVVVTNRGTGYAAVDSITLDFSAGGGTGASGTAHINAHIMSATVTFSGALPANIAVGMPISFRGIEGDNDAGAINGAWIVTAFDATNRRVSFDMTFPKGTPVDPTSITSGASGYFPPHWLECYGGFSGVDNEGMFNVGRGGELLTQYLHAAWNPSAQVLPRRNAQRCISTNLVAARFHNIRGPSIIAGWPGGAIRLVQSGGSYLNAVHIGTAPYGSTTFIIQNGGWTQISSSSIGGSKSQSANIGDGCHLQQSANYYGAGDAGIVSNGGTGTFTTCKLSSLNNALEARNGGKLFSSSTSTASAFIQSCTTAAYWDNGGRIFMSRNIIVNCTNEGRDAAGTQSYGGGWLAGVGSRFSETRLFNAGARVGATAGWAVSGVTANLGWAANLPASQTGSTLVIPISGLKVGDIITGFHVVAQIEATSGNTVTLAAELRKHTALAGEPGDVSVGAISGVSVTADTLVDNTLAGAVVTGFTEVVAQNETFYVLITATTGASTDIALLGVAVATER